MKSGSIEKGRRYLVITIRTIYDVTRASEVQENTGNEKGCGDKKEKKKKGHGDRCSGCPKGDHKTDPIMVCCSEWDDRARTTVRFRCLRKFIGS